MRAKFVTAVFRAALTARKLPRCRNDHVGPRRKSIGRHSDTTSETIYHETTGTLLDRIEQRPLVRFCKRQTLCLPWMSLW
jgi:hypothetical protein